MHMVERFEVWYGSTLMCCGCGDSWGDEGLNVRPFRRGWRRQERAKALALYDRALSPAAFRDACQAEMDGAA